MEIQLRAPMAQVRRANYGLEMEANLVEMMYRNRNRQMSIEPAGEPRLHSQDLCCDAIRLMSIEILNRIHQSLRNKVAALEEDNWMYEAEVDSRA